MILFLVAMLGAIAGPPTAEGAKAGEPSVPQLGDCAAAAPADAASREALAWTAARDSNRLDDFRGFAARFPGSACAVAAQRWVALREKAADAWAADYAADPAGGPRPAMVIGNVFFGITVADYPALALSNGEEGTVRAAFDVSTDGQIEACHVTQSSGSASLDQETCRIMTRRARFRPARDGAGRPVPAHGSRAIAWRLPTAKPSPPENSVIPGWRVRVAPHFRR